MRNMRRQHRFTAILLMMFGGPFVFCQGCGDGRCPVQGEVTFEGKPVDEGSISFEPADGIGPTTGGKIVGGKYELKNAAAPFPGKKTVRVVGMRKTGRKVRDQFVPNVMLEETQPYIPAVYNSRSTLSCDVGKNSASQLDFHLKSP